MSSTPAGWYPTPEGRQRYWDGSQWTEHFADGSDEATAAPMGSAGAADAIDPETGADAPDAATSSFTSSFPAPPASPDDTAAAASSRPLWKKKRFIIPAGLAAVIVGSVALSGGGEDTPTSVDAASVSSTPSASAPATKAAAPTASPSPPAATAAAPAPAPAPAPDTSAYDEAYGTFTAISKSGRGDSVIKLPKGASAGIVVMTHKGSSNFAVNVLDASNQSTGDLLANEIGKFKGTAAFGLIDLGDPAKLQISADGTWTIKVEPISAAKQLSPAQKGSGANVFLYDGDAADWAIVHKGKSNFSVNQVGGTFPNLAVNEIGNYKGTVPLDGGPSVVMIDADGTWSLTRQ